MTSSEEETLLRRGKWTYVAALLLIAMLNLGSLVVIDRIVHRQSDSALLINVSGRQRMLSQRIVKVALERAVHSKSRSDVAAQKILRESVARMDAVHYGLMHGSAELRLPVPSKAVMEVYTGPRWHLDAQLQSFLAHAHVLAEETAAETSFDDPNLLAIETEARTPLLDALDAAVVADQQHSEQGIAKLRVLLGLLTSLMLVILLAVALLLFRPLFQRLTFQQERLIAAGQTDALTGCWNRRAFAEMGQSAIERARRSGEALSLLSLDLDHFKAVNDQYGHAAGDLVLQTFAAALMAEKRSLDMLFRMGGEEFTLLLPAAGVQELLEIAERFRRTVEAAPIKVGATEIFVTMSMGAASLSAADAGLNELLERADLALYEAKRTGRNRVVAAVPPSVRKEIPAVLGYASVA